MLRRSTPDRHAPEIVWRRCIRTECREHYVVAVGRPSLDDKHLRLLTSRQFDKAGGRDQLHDRAGPIAQKSGKHDRLTVRRNLVSVNPRDGTLRRILVDEGFRSSVEWM